MKNMVKEAKKIAYAAHAGQQRRDGITPYIFHVEAVVGRLRGEPQEVLATAWLHDVLEDTEVSGEDLAVAGFPRDVLIALHCLTKRHSYEQYIEIVSGNEIAKKVKVADMLSNLADDPTDFQIVKYAKALLCLVK